MYFQYDLVLLRYSSTDIFIAITFIFNVIFTPKIICCCWFIVIFSFFFMLKKILNISKSSMFNYLSFFFYLNRFLISLIAVQFSSFFSLKRFLISLMIFTSSGIGFFISICYEKNNNFLEKIKVLKK